MTTQNSNQNNGQGSGRKNGRNPNVTIIPGPGSRGQKGPWKYARCGKTDIPIYRGESRDRPLFQVPCSTSEGKPTKKSFRVEAEAIQLASELAPLPPGAAATFSAIPRDQLAAIAEALEKLEPVLAPLKISVSAGIEEYARVKAKAGDHLSEIVEALEKLRPVLAPLNVSVSAGIEEYAGAKAVVEHKDLRQIVKDYCAEPWVKKGLTPLGEAVEQFLAARKAAHHRPSYVYTLRRNLCRLSVESGAPRIGEVTKDQLVKVIRGAGKPRSQKTFQTSFRTFFKWCKIQEYLNPAKPTEAEKLDKIIVANPPPGIYTVPEARKILGEITDVPSLLYVALSFFTGIRQIELGRIDWTAVNTDGVIDVDASKEKRYRRRLVPIQPVLHAWLSPFYCCTGLIVPLARMREKISTIISSLEIKYQRNGFRHSYASYRLAQTDSVMTTSQEDGHSAYVLEHDYLHRVTREQGLEFFKLAPEACGRTNWPQEVAEYLGTHPPVKERRTWKSSRPCPIAPQQPTDAPLNNGDNEEGGRRAAA